MANVIVMFSGGCNSTYALWKWLKDTNHDVTAIRGRIQPNEPQSHSEENESNRADQIVDWLKNNVRNFSFETVDFIPYVEDFQEMRPGFSATFNYGCLRPRYEMIAKLIRERSPDIMVVGLAVENTSHWGWPHFQDLVENPDVQFYFAGRSEEIPQGEAYDHATIAATLSGKCEQYAALPDALKQHCRNWDGSEDNPRAIQMLTWKAIDKWLADGKDPREFDLHCAQLGHYGSWCHLADPQKALYRSSKFNSDGYIENYLADIAGIPRYFQYPTDD